VEDGSPAMALFGSISSDGGLRISAAAGKRDLGGGEERKHHLLPTSCSARPEAARGGQWEAPPSVAAVLI
jgi:hypothetical protein